MRESSLRLGDQLIQRFKATIDRVPEWAWTYMPPVPLVGERFPPNEGLLIYASAENLSWLNATPTPARFTTEQAWDRHRVWYDQEGRDNGRFFPDVGIQPITDGGLLAAGLFVLRSMGRAIPDKPRPFIETIALTNWCKFSIRSVMNTDYVSDLKRLAPSLPFVIAELSLLKPAIVLVPARIWAHPTLAAAMRGASSATRFLPVPQFNATVVNCHLGKYDVPALALRQRLPTDPLTEWMSQLSGLPKAASWRYLACLEYLLRTTNA